MTTAVYRECKAHKHTRHLQCSPLVLSGLCLEEAKLRNMYQFSVDVRISDVNLCQVFRFLAVFYDDTDKPDTKFHCILVDLL